MDDIVYLNIIINNIRDSYISFGFYNRPISR